MSETRTCIICLETGNIQTKKNVFNCECQDNMFHEKCWEEYKKSYNICPLCRKRADYIIEIPEGEPVVNTDPNRCIINTVAFVFQIYWTCVVAFFISGLVLNRNYNEIYIISAFNMIFGLIDGIIGFLNWFKGQNFVINRISVFMYRLIIILFVIRIGLYIVTISVINDTKQDTGFYIGSVMTIVYYTCTMTILLITNIIIKCTT